MKKTILITMIAAAVLLTGCSSNISNTSNTSSASEASGTSSESQAAQITEEAAPTAELSQAETSGSASTVDTAESESPEIPEESGEFALAGPGGDRISASDIARVDASDEEDYIANGISATNWRQAETNGFAYLAEPGGEYKRVNIGDEICGLTLFDGGCVFSADNKAESGAHADESYFSSGFAEFEGSIELSGTLTTAAEDSGLVEAGSVVFTPDDGAKLPIMNYMYDSDKGVFYPEDSAIPAIVVTGVEPQTEGEHVTLALSGISMTSIVNNASIVRCTVSGAAE